MPSIFDKVKIFMEIIFGEVLDVSIQDQIFWFWMIIWMQVGCQINL